MLCPLGPILVASNYHNSFYNQRNSPDGPETLWKLIEFPQPMRCLQVEDVCSVLE